MAKQVLIFWGIKEANFCQEVLNFLGSYTRISVSFTPKRYKYEHPCPFYLRVLLYTREFINYTRVTCNYICYLFLNVNRSPLLLLLSLSLLLLFMIMIIIIIVSFFLFWGGGGSTAYLIGRNLVGGTSIWERFFVVSLYSITFCLVSLHNNSD